MYCKLNTPYYLVMMLIKLCKCHYERGLLYMALDIKQEVTEGSECKRSGLISSYLPSANGFVTMLDSDIIFRRPPAKLHSTILPSVPPLCAVVFVRTISVNFIF